MKDGQENYDKATEIVTNMTYVNEAVYKSGNYTKKFLNDTKGINDPRGYGFIHSGKPYKNSKGLLEFNIDLNGTLLQGSEASIENREEIYTTFGLFFNHSALFQKYEEECKKNIEC